MVVVLKGLDIRRTRMGSSLLNQFSLKHWVDMNSAEQKTCGLIYEVAEQR